LASKKTHVAYMNYEEAQRLIPIFEYYAKETPGQGQWKDVKTNASVILQELRLVRDENYSPLPGRQFFLTGDQYDFLMDARNEL
jgi:hypothetical protein